MSKLAKLAAVLFITAMVFGCASSKSSTDTSADSKPLPSGTPSATIHWEGKEFMAILDAGWGHGTVALNGKVYKFKSTDG